MKQGVEHGGGGGLGAHEILHDGGFYNSHTHKKHIMNLFYNFQTFK
jgi:hypothetical protein